MFKLARLLRLRKFYGFLSATEDTKISMKLAAIIVSLVLFLHWITCGYFKVIHNSYD
jgi:hypothetical protein